MGMGPHSLPLAASSRGTASYSSSASFEATAELRTLYHRGLLVAVVGQILDELKTKAFLQSSLRKGAFHRKQFSTSVGREVSYAVRERMGPPAADGGKANPSGVARAT
jgi:hypothetical protein